MGDLLLRAPGHCAEPATDLFGGDGGQQRSQEADSVLEVGDGDPALADSLLTAPGRGLGLPGGDEAPQPGRELPRSVFFRVGAAELIEKDDVLGAEQGEGAAGDPHHLGHADLPLTEAVPGVRQVVLGLGSCGEELPDIAFRRLEGLCDIEDSRPAGLRCRVGSARRAGNRAEACALRLDGAAVFEAPHIAQDLPDLFCLRSAYLTFSRPQRVPLRIDQLCDTPVHESNIHSNEPGFNGSTEPFSAD